MSDREQYRHFLPIPTRWKDNDVYGHVNNVEYYSYFDTVINTYLIAEGGLDIHRGAAIGLCAESHCRFLGEIAFPETIEAGLRVDKLGNSSVRYGIGLFRRGQDAPAAEGWFVHVFVDRITRKSLPIPTPIRAALARICRGADVDAGAGAAHEAERGTGVADTASRRLEPACRVETDGQAAGPAARSFGLGSALVAAQR